MEFWREDKYEIIFLGAALGIYGFNKLFMKQFLSHWFIQSYLNDVMAGICLSVIGQFLTRFWFKRQIKVKENIALICFAGSYWEFIGPMYIARSVTDIKDLAAYLSGGVIVILIRYLKKKMEKEGSREMKCKVCGCELNAEAKFCPSCGEKVSQRCPNCGKILPEGVNFCGSCGYSVLKKETSDSTISPLEINSPVKETDGEEQADAQNRQDAKQVVESDKTESDSGKTEIVLNAENAPRTLEMFKTELKELGERDQASKAVIALLGTKVFCKQFYPVLRNDESLIVIRHIQSKLLLARYRKEFVVLTDKRIIKFEKLQYIKPKIESLFLRGIQNIQTDAPSNAVSGTFIGEKFIISGKNGQQISMRMVGKGAAKEFEECIVKEKSKWNDGQPPAISEEANHTPPNKKSSKKKKAMIAVGIIIAAILCFCVVDYFSSKTALAGKVENGYLGYYNDVTVGDVFEEVLAGGSWDEMATDTEEFSVVQYAVKSDDTVIQFKIESGQQDFNVIYMKYMGEVMQQASDCKIKLDELYGDYYKKHPELGRQEDVSWDNVTTEGHFTPIAAPVTAASSEEFSESAEILDNSFILQDSDKRFLEDSEISSLTDYEKLAAMYEIMARHGATFGGVDDGDTWQAYFDSQEWYVPVMPIEEIPDSEFNVYEMSNIQKISDSISVVETSADYESYFYLPYSDIIYYTEQDLIGFTKDELRLARNEIYARHGRLFETEDLNQYFSGQPWYYGYLSADEFDDSVLNEYEKANLDTIKMVESQRESGSLYTISKEDIFKEFNVNGQAAWSRDSNDIYMVPEMETYEGFGEIIMFSAEPNTYDYSMLYYCDVEEISATASGGLDCKGTLYNYHTGEVMGKVQVTWDSNETIDYPTVILLEGNVDLEGAYQYYGLTE